MNKTIWITGASHGIGKHLALQYAEQGHIVCISARGEKALNELSEKHTNIHSFPLDVTDEKVVQDTKRGIEKQYGPIDLALLNAGVYTPIPGGIGESSIFAEHMQVNYLGVVHALMTLLPVMKQQGKGQVAIVASVAGYVGLPQAAAYGPTKAALINLAETLRTEFADSGVDIRLINPGFVTTRLTEQNDFKMPAIVSAQEAAERIITGLGRKQFEIAFPTRFVLWLKLLRLLPYSVYFWLARRMKT